MNIKKSTIIFSLVLISFIFLHGYILMILEKPYSGISASLDSKGNYVITKISKVGWVSYTGIQTGDTLKEMNGEKLNSDSSPTREAFSFAKELAIEKNGFLSYYKASGIKLKSSLYEIYIPVIFSILVLLLSIFIYQKHSLTANYLIGFLLATSLSYSSSAASGRGDFGAKLILVLLIQPGVLLFVYFLYSVFFDKQIIKERFPAFLKVTTLLTFVTIMINLYSLFFTAVHQVSSVTLVSFIIIIIYSICFLIYTYIKKKDSVHEPFLKWMIVIKVIAFSPFIFFHAIPYILGWPYLVDDIAGLFLFVIPLGYCYLLMTKQLLDIDFIISKGRYYAFLSLVPTFLISLLVTGIANQDNNSFSRFLLNFILILIFNILFLFLKEKVDFSFRNQLFQDKTNLTQSIDQFTQKLSSIMKQDELESFFVHEIIKALQAENIILIDYNLENTILRTKEVYGNNFKIYKQIKWILQNDSAGTLLEYKGLIGIQLYKIGQQKTYIWIGQKKNNTRFNINEKTWMITTAKYVRLVYENLFAVNSLIQSLEKQQVQEQSSSASLSRLLFQLSEKERRKLASDLHDSALQDQIIWYRKLENLITENKDLSKETETELSKIKNGMVDVINQIRHTCNELRPNLLLEAGLTQSLQELFSNIQLRVKYTLDYEFDQIQDTFDNFNTPISIYRILQELLNNADKHSDATNVAIHMWEDNQRLHIDYRDNGKGFNLEIFNKQTNHIHMGLSGLKERILSLHGKVEFISAEGQGLQVHITLPR
ncbi:sensor histidine kinase [Metabacillus fastidiosus]|uniref:sensor histidine kinase n=1 Tax=Metabacillus fastidiosus TaxID=1458 RepID=UPI000826B991|nr:ATP-binding protein [Metabacillus fastidiosus]MED4455322.1 ATP-binding protein [Metabacillus fastidiosus]MED4461513.1 ATP-binding protein [Metabacillus fastidiosus]